MPSGPAVGVPLTLERVDEALSAVAAETGPGSAERRLRSLRALLESTDEAGRRLLVELLLGEVRQGALEGLVIEAIARASGLAAVGRASRRDVRAGPGRAGPRRARGGSGRPRPLLVAPALAGGADAGEPGRRRRGGAGATRRGGLRVQAGRRAAAGPPGGRRGARLHPAAAGRDARACPRWWSGRSRFRCGRPSSRARRSRCARTGGRAPSRRRCAASGRSKDVEAARRALPLASFFFDALYLEGEGPLVVAAVLRAGRAAEAPRRAVVAPAAGRHARCGRGASASSSRPSRPGTRA